MKPKTIKLKKKDREEMDRLAKAEMVAMYGIETAHRLHYEAKERLWNALRNSHPEIIPSNTTNANYHQGVITYTPKEKP